jgi:hypothetical protein
VMAAAVEADKAEAQVEAAVEVEAEVPVEFPSGGGAFGAAPAAASAASASAAASPVFGSAPVSQGEVKAAAEEQAAPTAPSLVPFDAARAALTSCANPAGAAPANRSLAVPPTPPNSAAPSCVNLTTLTTPSPPDAQVHLTLT